MVPGSPVVLQLLRLVAAVSMLAVAGLALRQRETAVGRPFALLVSSHAVWSVLVLVASVLDPASGPVGTVLGLSITAASVLPPVGWLLYALAVTGRRRFLGRRRYALLGAATVAIPALLVVRSFGGDSLPSSVALLYWLALILLVAGMVGVIVVGSYLLVRLASRYRQLSYRQMAVLTAALIAPYVFTVGSRLSRPTGASETTDYLPVDIVFVGFLVAAVGFGVAMRRYPVFTAFPEADRVARDDVLEELTVALFILDTDEKVLDANAEALRLCPEPAESVIGSEIGDGLSGLVPLPTGDTTRLSLSTTDGQRRYEVTSSPIADASDATMGRTILLRDITDRQTREQQLEVLTRVLRHNLRNDLDTILAHVEEIDDRDRRSRIVAGIRSTQRTARKARAVESVLAASHEQRHEVNLAATAASVADELRERYGECDISVETPASVVVVAHEQLLDRLLTELIENGLEHSTADRPAVDVSIAAAGGAEPPTIEVSDNGSGIPAHEFETLAAGTETQLKHGSGVGLWLVNWIVEYLGGDLAFETADSSGTTVRITLHGTPMVDAAEA